MRRWIRRILFILILLCIAFFIYWIFSPSWASRLWYNIRTFPQRVTSWFSNQSFLDYDTYKIDTPSIWDSIDVDFIDEEDENYDIDDEDNEFKQKKSDKSEKEIKEEKNVESEKKSNSKSESKGTIKSFPRTIKFVKMPELGSNDVDSESDSPILTWYSKSDLMWIVSRYIETNLDSETDIFVTIEYEDNSLKPDRIILKTQPKSARSDSTVVNESVLDLFISSQKLNSENIVVSLDEDIEDEDQSVDVNQNDKKEVSVKSETSTKSTASVKKNTSSSLTQKEQKEAEEIFSILF